MFIVILAGGAGTRFWPLSRRMQPKQLMSILGGKSMLQKTVERVLPLHPQGILVITNTLQADQTAVQLAHINDVPIHIIEEPVGRNTAPAIGLAAALIERHDRDAVMAVLPADHYIRNEEDFRKAILQAREAAMGGSLVTLGIMPDRPETGYGYIEAGTRHVDGSYAVTRFVEKPAGEKALEFLNSGKFYWNSGIFVWQVRSILRELEEHMPELSTGLRKLNLTGDTLVPDDMHEQIASLYTTIKSESIDYGVMEKAAQVNVIPGDFGWSDVGSWRALPDVVPSDESKNVMMNVPDAVNIDSRECLVYGGGKLVALVGVQNLIIVNTDDALLVCRDERAQDVKKVAEELEKRGLTDYL